MSQDQPQPGKDQVIAYLESEEARLANEYNQTGLTPWGILGSLGAISWLLLEDVSHPIPNTKAVIWLAISEFCIYRAIFSAIYFFFPRTRPLFASKNYFKPLFETFTSGSRLQFAYEASAIAFFIFLAFYFNDGYLNLAATIIIVCFGFLVGLIFLISAWNKINLIYVNQEDSQFSSIFAFLIYSLPFGIGGYLFYIEYTEMYAAFHPLSMRISTLIVLGTFLIELYLKTYFHNPIVHAYRKLRMQLVLNQISIGEVAHRVEIMERGMSLLDIAQKELLPIVELSSKLSEKRRLLEDTILELHVNLFKKEYYIKAITQYNEALKLRNEIIRSVYKLIPRFKKQKKLIADNDEIGSVILSIVQGPQNDSRTIIQIHKDLTLICLEHKDFEHPNRPERVEELLET